MQRHDFDVTVINTEDMRAITARLGVSAKLQSCHAATVRGYVIEGHVPTQAISRLLTEKPKAEGLRFLKCLLGRPEWRVQYLQSMMSFSSEKTCCRHSTVTTAAGRCDRIDALINWQSDNTRSACRYRDCKKEERQ